MEEKVDEALNKRVTEVVNFKEEEDMDAKPAKKGKRLRAKT